MIKNYNDFCQELKICGFTLNGKSKGIYSIIPDWAVQDDSPIKWHTEDAETDPWEWRMRVLEEYDDIAYGKLFFNTSGYITKEWYPYFLTIRRKGKELEEEYYDGNISAMEKKIYDIIVENGVVSLDVIKKLAGVTKEDKSKFDRAITHLQMKMYITMCGKSKKISRSGNEFGWNSTVFCTVEKFWGEEFVESSFNISIDEAEQKIRKQLYSLNPDAEEKNICKFIGL